MTDFKVTDETMQRISNLSNPHLRALNGDITAEFPDMPDMAYTLAMGYAVAVLLNSLSDPAARMNAVNGINIMTRHYGFVLTPTT
jgi:hypothetical protein